MKGKCITLGVLRLPSEKTPCPCWAAASMAPAGCLVCVPQPGQTLPQKQAWAGHTPLFWSPHQHQYSSWQSWRDRWSKGAEERRGHKSVITSSPCFITIVLYCPLSLFTAVPNLFSFLATWMQLYFISMEEKSFTNAYFLKWVGCCTISIDSKV